MSFGLALLLAANCEAGGYTIHTIAEYKKYEAKRVPIVYVKQGQWLDVDLNAIDVGAPFDGAPVRTLTHRGGSCALGSVKIPLSGRLKLGSCAEFAKALPQRAYAFFDTTKGIVDFPDELPLAEALPQERSQAEAAAEALLPQLTLHANNFMEEKPGGDDVLDLLRAKARRFEHAAAGGLPPRFLLSTMVLTLPHAYRYYSYATDAKPHDFDFPVLFLTLGNAKMFYFGDGSECAFSRTSSQRTAKNLGPTDRFKLTGAYDFDGDGLPDVIEINRAVAYLIENGTLKVIDYTQGC
jgi:hypothetical protein